MLVSGFAIKVGSRSTIPGKERIDGCSPEAERPSRRFSVSDEEPGLRPLLHRARRHTAHVFRDLTRAQPRSVMQM